MALGGILFVSLEMYKSLVKNGREFRNVGEIGIVLGLVIAFLVTCFPESWNWENRPKIPGDLENYARSSSKYLP